MSRIVRGALVQATWTGDKESMIQKHEQYAHEAAKDGAQFILFQELFYGGLVLASPKGVIFLLNK